MKLFIWEGGGITTGFHQDGTLVVLAEDVDQARRLARDSAQIWNRFKHRLDGNDPGHLWADGAAPYCGIYIDHKPGPEPRWRRDPIDTNPAIDREPDRTVELDYSQVVAWNGGGYD